jgi:flagellar motor switch protein FliM
MRSKRKNRKKLLKKKDDTEEVPTEVLSQQEIDQLLTAINAGDPSEEEEFKSHGFKRNERRIRIYDFKRPDKFTKEAIRSFSILHEAIAKDSTYYFSDKLNTTAHIHVASVDQLNYEEFIRSIPTPTTMLVLDVFHKGTQRQFQAVIEIDPVFIKSALYILFDGIQEEYEDKTFKVKQFKALHEPKNYHELTILEKSVLNNMLDGFVKIYSDVYEKNFGMTFKLNSIETNPQFIMACPLNDMTVLVTMEARILNTESMINFCMPFRTMECIYDQLTFDHFMNAEYPINKKSIDFNPEIILKAVLSNQIIKYNRISNLKINDILYLNIHKDICTIDSGNFTLFECSISDSKVTINKIAIKENNFMEDKQNIYPAEGFNTINEALNEMNIQCIVELGRTILKQKDVLGLGEGSIIELDSEAGSTVDIFINNVKIGKGEVVVIDEAYGVRVTELNEK